MDSKNVQIEQRIKELGAGNVFIPADFLDIASQQAIKLVLSRLEKAGEIKRIMRGIYVVPEYSDYLNREIDVAPGDVVSAIARKNNWIVIPSGDNALNSLGLSTQIPARFEYISSGPYKKYEYNGIELELKHRANRDLVNKRYKSSLVIQALKAIGETRVEDNTLDSLLRALSVQEIEWFYEDAKSSSAWIFEIAKCLYQKVKS